MQPTLATGSLVPPAAHRFTRDGSDALEQHLAHTCERVLKEIRVLLPPGKLEALVLGGGYGRGEGGVLRTPAGDQPYNDLEFYVFLRGLRLWNEHLYRQPLHELGDRLSPSAGLHVEFKIDALARLRRCPVSMFTYDLLNGHYTVYGREADFAGCEYHREARRIPPEEGARLLLNRCTGLLLAKDLLQKDSLTDDDADFIGRNISKTQLALGDAMLAAFGEYFYECRERHRRLEQLLGPLSLPGKHQVLEHHAQGLEFKLHPARSQTTRAELERQHRAVSQLACQVWLWLESLRLSSRFAAVSDYVLSPLSKCPEARPWANYLLNLRTFGPKAAVAPLSFRYPRERLFNTLPVLLWEEAAAIPQWSHHLQSQLLVPADDWRGWVSVYRSLWEKYG